MCVTSEFHHPVRCFASDLSKKIKKLCFAGKMLAEPGSGISPFLPGLVHCDAKGRCDVFMAQACKMSHFYDSGRQRIFACQARQRSVQSKEPFIRI